MDKTVVYVKMNILKEQGLTLDDMYKIINERSPEIRDQYVLIPEPKRFDIDEIFDIEELTKQMAKEFIERKPNRAERRAARRKK